MVYLMKARSRLPVEPAFDELVELVRDLPRGRTGQIIQGKLHVSAGCGPAHTHTLGELSATLLAGSPLGDPPPSGWTFLTDVELAFPQETLVVADIAGWRLARNRIAGLPTPIELVPHWICEVLDPRTRALDLTHKRRAYALSGVESLWVVDPMARVLEVFDNQSGRWVLSLAVSEDEVAASPFKRLRFDVSDLWMPRASHLPPPMPKRKSPALTSSRRT
jgi:Uma2 family endonuclease